MHDNGEKNMTGELKTTLNVKKLLHPFCVLDISVSVRLKLSFFITSPSFLHFISEVKGMFVRFNRFRWTIVVRQFHVKSCSLYEHILFRFKEEKAFYLFYLSKHEPGATNFLISGKTESTTTTN